MGYVCDSPVVSCPPALCQCCTRAVSALWAPVCQHRHMTLQVYTDGACLGNPGPGGWAWAIPGGRWASGVEASSTNQRMEILAAAQAVRTLGPDHAHIEVVSDSTYVVNCFNDGWWKGWMRRGWVNSQRKPVANRDLWEPFIADVTSHAGITFRWVKGHSDDPGNDLVDALATEAARTQQAGHGDGTPTVAPR